MNTEKILFNLVVLALAIYIFNRYLVKQKTIFLVVLTGQFFSLILSGTTFFNNVKPNLTTEVIISVFGLVIPGLIFFYSYFINKEFRLVEFFKNIFKSFSERKNIEVDERFLLEDGSKDKYGLGPKIKIIGEKPFDDLIRGYNCLSEEIPKSVKDELISVSRLIELKAWRKALETYLSIEKKCSDNPVLQFNIGNMYYHLKEFQNAINRYNKSNAMNLQARKNNADFRDGRSRKTAARRIKDALRKVEDYENLFNIAACLVNQGKYDKAVETFKKAAENKENWINVYEPLAVIYEALGNSSEAAEMYENLAEIYPENFEIQRKAGDFLCKTGEYEKAKLFYERAVILEPDFSQGYINIGDYMLSKENFIQAVSFYKQALQISPDRPEIHYNLGNAFYGSEQKLQALSEYKKAIELNENDYKSYYNLGVILDELQMKEEAVLAFEHVLDIKPDFYDASNNLSVILCSFGKYEEAISNYLKALQYNPSNLELYFNLAITLEYQKKYDQAEELYKNIIKMNSKTYDAYYNLGIIRFQKGDSKQAEHYFRKAVEVNQDYHKAFYQLSKVYALTREYGRCINYLGKAIWFSAEYIEKARVEPLFDDIKNLKSFENLMNQNVISDSTEAVP